MIGLSRLTNIRHNTGFTLIELIVVLLIMTTMMAVAAPRVAGRSEAAVLRAAASDFQTLASAARAKAVLQQRTISLTIDKQGRSIGLFAILPATVDGDQGNEGPPSDNAREDQDQEPVSRSRGLSEGLVATIESDTPDANTINFYPDGSADQSTLTISNARDEQLKLSLAAATGRLRLAE